MTNKHEESGSLGEISPDASLRFKPRAGGMTGSQEEKPDEALAKRNQAETYDSVRTDAAKVVDL